MKFHRKDFTDQKLLFIYEALVFPRMIEEKMLLLLRQGKISKWFSGIGQEAISVGSTLALESNDFILPLHRNLGVFTSRKIDLKKLFCQLEGKKSGFTKGRDRTYHFGVPEYRIIGMISHLGANLGVADGIALGSKLAQDNGIALVFSGDGGTSEGDFHEAVNVAAVWELPVIFLIENNGYGLSTPSDEQFRCKQLIDKCIGYGIEGVRVDGNNVLEVYKTVSGVADIVRHTNKPFMIEAMTFRMRGHEEASGTKYVPKELFEEWGKKDPVKNYEDFLMKEKILNQKYRDEIHSRLKKQMEEALEFTFAQPEISPYINEELNDVYAISNIQHLISNDQSLTSEKRFVDALSDGLRQMMEQHENVIIMGQDVAEYGGVFKVTEGFVERFGKSRVRNTPLCESAIIGAGLGLALKGYKSVIEMQFADFVTCGFNQVVNNLAKNNYRWNVSANVVIRMPTGAGVGAGPFHSQSNEAWFFHVPGLKIVYPSNPYDAKGLIASAILDPNPVLYFEHKGLYRSISGNVPDDLYSIEIGKANIINEGDDLTIVAYGWAVHWAKNVIEKFPDASIEIIDLRSLMPWDKETVINSLKKTGRLLVVHEDTLTGGIGAEISAYITENYFQLLDAPVMRCASLNTPIPFNTALEKTFLGSNFLEEKVKKILEY